MKLYIRSAEQSFTAEDYKAALLLLKKSTNLKEIAKAQEVIREYQASNPESATKIKEEFNTPRPRKPGSTSPKDPKFFTSSHIRW
jgi:hypothetical protein